MSNADDNDLNLDLHFLPAWAKEPSNRNLYSDFEGEREDRGGRRGGDRFPRRRDGLPPRDRQPTGAGGPRPPRAEGTRREDRPRRDFAGRGGSGPGRRGGAEARPAPVEPPPQIKLTIIPEEKGVDSLARQIRMTGRAYPLFGVALMILARPERHNICFSVIKGPEGQVLQPLYVCALDDTLWLTEQQAVDYVLSKHFNMFYQAEKTPVEPPKGTYTFVAQCGMSGVVLGPPNHHDYQNQLRKLHSERFSRMPFETFKSRVKIVRDEAVIKQWVESQSWRTEYVCLNMPEPLRLTSLEAVEKHFRENHLPIIIKQVESHTLNGAAARALRCGPLARMARAAVEEQRRFPLQVSTVLSQQFAARGLQFFKVNKNITHVAVARPHYLDLEATPVSNGVRQIVTYIAAHPRCTRRQLFEALLPASALAPSPAAPPAPTAATEAGEPGQPPPAEGQSGAVETAPPPSAGPSPELTALISDLHWLIHQGHVLEFADGMLETAKKPAPKPPPKPATPSPAGQPSPAPAEGASEATTQAPAGAELVAAGTPATEEAAPAPPIAATPMPAEPAVVEGSSEPAIPAAEPPTEPSSPSDIERV